MFFCLSSTRNQDLTCGSILLIIILKDQGKKLKNSVTECSLSCPSNSAVLMQVPLHNNVVIIPAAVPRENYLVFYLSSSTNLYF